jgi:hypothetical protein
VDEADPSGQKDSTAIIQNAIDKVGSAGGGVVQLPQGTFRINPPEDSSSALRISHSGVVLRGAGIDKTYLFCDDPRMREKAVISINGDTMIPLGGEDAARAEEIPLSRDITRPTTELHLTNTGQFSVGDWVVIRTDVTDSFIAEIGMQGKWHTKMKGPMLFRRITKIDSGKEVIWIDVPTRGALKTRDNLRVHRIPAMLEEIGVEDLSIGMQENNDSTLEDNEKAYKTEGTAGFNVHQSALVSMNGVSNCWLRRTSSYRPAGNKGNWHMQSNGFRIGQHCRQVTIEDCTVGWPQYGGEGGNGYGFSLAGNDCLISNCAAIRCRHNFSLKGMNATGNVIHKSLGKDSRLPSDFHMWLSRANLFDSMTMDNDFLQGRIRPCGAPLHGHSTSESVFWNTKGVTGYHRATHNVVVSKQFGHGYVIGTRGPYSSAATQPTIDYGYETAPEDFAEGIGKSDTLEPQSLYEAQLQRRLKIVKNRHSGTPRSKGKQ